MKFDLFDAMSILRKEFGDNSQLLLYTRHEGIHIRLSVYTNENDFHTEFTVSYEQANNDEYVTTMNFEFKKSIRMLQDLLRRDGEHYDYKYL